MRVPKVQRLHWLCLQVGKDQIQTQHVTMGGLTEKHLLEAYNPLSAAASAGSALTAIIKNSVSGVYSVAHHTET